jgi:hypothetical protein
MFRRREKGGIFTKYGFFSEVKGNGAAAALGNTKRAV